MTAARKKKTLISSTFAMATFQIYRIYRVLIYKFFRLKMDDV